MKVTVKWLNDYVKIKTPIAEICDKLTMAGLEVAEVKVFGDWKNVAVGEIVGVKPHPNADRLHLATVNLGTRQQTVVCGAPNVAVGDKIAFASPGAELIDGHTGKLGILKPARIRGISSEGMVCSEKELGISDKHEGIMVLPTEAPVGTPLSDYMGDIILDVEITPNRPDCMSVIGIAREIAAQTKVTVNIPDISYKEAAESIQSLISIEIKNPELCPRYCASALMEVKLGPSPVWMQRRLIACGMRPINNVVDITNYVMMEYGQPLHAFDYNKLRDRKIIIRPAYSGEPITTLDGTKRTLNKNILVISDAEKAIAIAGIMGGSDTEVTDNTDTVLIESANFNQAVIHRGSLDLKLSSEASIRFEKGLSTELALVALKRATQLMHEITGGKVMKGIADLYPGFIEKKSILLSTGEVRRLLGVGVNYQRMVEALQALGFICDKSLNENESRVIVPWWRTDINYAADLVEEVARIIGYDSIPATQLSGSLPDGVISLMETFRDKISDIMIGCGVQEVINYSLTNLETMKKLYPVKENKGPEPLKLANPMSKELVCLRTEMRSGILTSLSRNQRFQQKNIRLFELGKVYIKSESELPLEKEILCSVVSSEQEQIFWEGEPENINFFMVKGLVSTLLTRLGLEPDFVSGQDDSFKTSNITRILSNNVEIGILGQLHPLVVSAFDISGEVYLFEIDIEKVCSLSESKYIFKPIPRYPSVVRDIALVVDDKITFKQLVDTIKKFELVTKVDLFDYYKGEQVPAGKKSLAFRLNYQADDHTLKDEEISRVQRGILDGVFKNFGATLRL